MQIFLHPLPLVLYILAELLHFVPLFLPQRWRKNVRFANICFHIFVFIACLVASISLEEVALLYLFSLLLYLLSFPTVRKRSPSAVEEEVKE